MERYRLKIELLSDLCAGNGKGYNSSLDTDVCQDKYGFPYIPGRRIKGILRECALELSDWGYEIDPDTLFGKEGDSFAPVRIGSAELESADIIRQMIEDNPNVSVFAPQNVLNCYSYIRTNTAVDYETGVADDQSLRNMRVVNKGTVFYADVRLRYPKMKDLLERCCMVYRHMGLHRTRGLGEVCVSLVEPLDEVSPNHIELKEGATRLEYRVELLEPFINKSVTVGESRTLDYIDGAKFLGLTAGYLREPHDPNDPLDFSGFMNQGDVFFSNAYLMKDDQRLTEVPAYIYSVKNHPNQFRNKLYAYEPNWPQEDAEQGSIKKRFDDIVVSEGTLLEEYQLNQAKHCYVSIEIDDEGRPSLVKESVQTEGHYHHRRPEDKSIGRAKSNDDGNADLYTLSSICPWQSFGGFVTGSPEQIEKVHKALTSKNDFFMGYGSSSEYGKVRITVTNTVTDEKPLELFDVKKLAIKLESPTIVYSENACYSTDKNDLLAEVLAALGLSESDVEEEKEYYLTYTVVGGFNVTWKRRKPSIQAFDKGSVLVLSFKEKQGITIPKHCYLGERTAEGFGEFTVEKVEDKESKKGKGLYPLTRKETEPPKAVIPFNLSKLPDNSKEKELAEKICHSLAVNYAKEKGREAVVNSKQFDKAGDGLKATISILTSMCGESELMWKESQKSKKAFDWKDDLTGRVNARFEKNTENKKKKLDISNEIIEKADETVDAFEISFENKYSVNGFVPDKNEIAYEYLKAYLQSAKYKLKE